MNLFKKIKDMIKNIFTKNKATNKGLCIQQGLNFYDNSIKNMTLYNGNEYEIQQLFSQLRYLDNSGFWCQIPQKDDVRRIHIDLPQVIVNTLTQIVSSSLVKMDINDAQMNEIWKDIDNDNKFNDVLEEAVKKCLIVGDGAFKITWDNNFSKYPIIEYVSGENISIEYKYGRLNEIVFKTPVNVNNKQMYFIECYGRGYIKYLMVDKNGSEINMKELEDYKDIEDLYFYKDGQIDTDICLAIPFKVFDSTEYDGRGRSVFDGRESEFDAVDEIFSTMIDNMRAGRTRTFVSENLLPRDENGNIMLMSCFDNRFIKTKQSQMMLEDGKENNDIQMIQGQINAGEYEIAFSMALNLSLHGIISPSSLGINDNRLVDSGVAEREREKTTIFVRNAIISKLTECIKTVMEMSLKIYGIQYKIEIDDNIKDDINVLFSEYANPTFESVVETVTKAVNGGVMSIEKAIDMLYGLKMSEDEKEEEINRIKSSMNVSNDSNNENNNENIDDDNKDNEAYREKTETENINLDMEDKQWKQYL